MLFIKLARGTLSFFISFILLHFSSLVYLLGHEAINISLCSDDGPSVKRNHPDEEQNGIEFAEPQA